MPKHFFFDLDKTLTVSRSPMALPHQEIFDHLCNTRDVVVVTGGTVEQIREQVTPRFEGKYYALAQSGNHAIDISGAELWREAINEAQSDAVHAFIEKLKRHFDLTVKDENDLVEHRGAQISYSVIGFHEDVEKKYAFDPDEKKRAAALAMLSEDVKRLNDVGIEVTPAGTTTYNFILLGKHKGYNVKRLADLKEWNQDDCVYVGDALFPGGNDESVIGVLPTKAVTNPEDTFQYLAGLLV
ncbi:MAG TPA: HAD-IIB family hydrolase [Candidatus Paceibacterota bacterium]|nr:HAD-IIB family hydrolase [Candidatus Paceibacterota bacterium]